MKRIIVMGILLLAVIACKDEPKNYVTLSGTISNQNSDSLLIFNSKQGFQRKINVAKDGTFSDTVTLVGGNYKLIDGKKFADVYLKNGYDLNINVDGKEFSQSIVFSGIGEDANNYLAKRNSYAEDAFKDQSLFELPKSDFDSRIREIVAGYSELLANTKNLDSTFVAEQNKKIEGIKNFLEQTYSAKNELLALKGTDSPPFTDYENYNGGSMSLEDFKGKYIYIDLWATWCGPCIAEVPFLKEIEKEYHGKNIAFVSISVDKKIHFEKWKNMVAEKQLPGTQLWAKEDKSFMEGYKVEGIPRFILIDPNGKVVSADAPRPSQPKLKELFDELNI